ncbi:MAG: alpha/beta fold hydrolase [Saccharospirillum sp.]|nr:alpha/beta fold hydrolase [Saccharospirillum sp.]
MTTRTENPEIGQSLSLGGLATNVHDQGRGEPVVLIHGSGPGVTAWANWRGVIPVLAQKFRVLAPDMLGFGYTERPAEANYNLDRWVQQVIDLLDAKGIAQTDLVGNSFGGAVALATAIRHPERVRRLVLMGSVGVPFDLTEGLDAVWGYSPGLDAMRNLVRLFAYDQSLATDDLVQMRYEASIRPGYQESFAALFPAPRQRWVDALCSPESEIRQLPHETLVLHGREDRIIPLHTSWTLSQWIPKAQLHVFSQCGHWTQIEQASRFTRLVTDFFSEGRSAAD